MAEGRYVRAPTGPVRLVLLVSAALLVNYIDRGNLATAVPLIRAEFGLSGKQLGVLLAAFYYSYVVAMVPAGWLGERYGAHRVLAAGIAVLVRGDAAHRLRRGFLVAPAAAAVTRRRRERRISLCIQLFASQLRLPQIDMANGVLGFSYLAGPAIGTVLGGLLMPIYGWRAVVRDVWRAVAAVHRAAIAPAPAAACEIR